MITKLKCLKDCCIAKKGDTFYANTEALYLDKNTSKFVIMKKYINDFWGYFAQDGMPEVSPAMMLPDKEFFNEDASIFVNIGIEAQSTILKTKPLTKEYLYSSIINYFYIGYFWNMFNTFNYVKIDEEYVKQIKGVAQGHLMFDAGGGIPIVNTKSMRLATADEVSGFFAKQAESNAK